MNFTVKNTTFRSILDLIYPCYCRGCGKFGDSFCFRCYNYNKALNPSFSRALEPYFHKLFVCGLREGMLLDLIADYKFHSKRQYLPVLTKMIIDALSKSNSLSNPSTSDVKSSTSISLPPDTIIVPLPTIRKHICSRGFDHILTLANSVSKETGFSVVSLLKRDQETVQVGKDDKTRREQARRAYTLDKEALNAFFGSNPSYKDFSRPILLLDDVWTTGSSMKNASFILRTAGFRNIYGLVLAKNQGYDFS